MRLRVGGILAGFVMIAAGGSVGCTRQPAARDMVPLGGPWYFYLHSGLPEAGRRPADLYREVNGTRVLVERDYGQHRYYEAQNCLLYERHRDEASARQTIAGACGDRPPIVMPGDQPYRWRMDPDGLRATGGPEPVDGGLAVATIPIGDIKAAAESGDTSQLRVRMVAIDTPADANVRRDDESRRSLLIDVVNPSSSVVGTVEQRLAMMESLIARGADVNAADARGVTPLLLAAGRDEASFIKPLLDAGAFVNAQDSLGRTPLMVAAESFRNQTFKVRMLLDAHADRSIRDAEGRTAAERLGPQTDPGLLLLVKGS